MNAKEISIENINAMALRVGKSVKGKGIEILALPERVFYTWSFNPDKEGIEKLHHSIKDEKIETLFVGKIRYNDVYREEAKERFDLAELIENNFEGVTDIELYREPKFLGYLPLSYYTSSKEDQLQLIKDVLALTGQEVYGEIEDDHYCLTERDDIRKINNSCDYHLEHGSNDTYVEDTGECEYFDGRMDNYNDSVMEGIGDGFDWFEEIDPDKKITVYHRKGKDWYFGYSLESDEVFLTYRDDDGELIEEEYFTYWSHTPDKELFEKIKDAAKSIKNGLEVSGYINNNFRLGNFNDHYEDYNDYLLTDETVVDFVSNQEPHLLRDEVEGALDSCELSNIDESFLKAYRKALSNRVTVKEDLSVEVNGISYNHLRILKALGKRFGYELVHSAVSSSVDTVAWAIKRDNEEYHFDILKVIAKDEEGEDSLKEFMQEALAALERRKLEKLTEAELFEKAKHVFVGVKDSLSAGNCQFGTSEFVAKHDIDISSIGGVRGDVLLEMECSNFTKRAVMYATMHHGVAA